MSSSCEPLELESELPPLNGPLDRIDLSPRARKACDRLRALLGEDDDDDGIGAAQKVIGTVLWKDWWGLLSDFAIAVARPKVPFRS
jgi:hypothetical protein